MRLFYSFIPYLLTVLTAMCCSSTIQAGNSSPRIINIVNFIRQTDYRLQDAEEQLFKATQEQVGLINRYDFPATFLFQYDALISPKYQELMRKNLSDRCEIGAWWEITQPHVEAAGLTWRGKHSWVSTANIAFTTGYTPEEREKLVDVYMVKFKEIYGKYPKSVGSWFIDSHTLAYMYDKYGIVASCNCKDQVGTDGYTLWGGYWNQAYYPSRNNAYMPAQTKDAQIPVPVFRMLGSDPIYQYDNGVGGDGQGVISLEPVYHDSGKNKKWVEYFMDAIVNQPALAFNYAQAGQENSFTWEAMREGLEMQFSILDSLKKVDQIQLETLENSGNWFRKQFPLTPATAVTALNDVRDEGNKTVWYNSRFYRSNLYWENGAFRFRDIHLFNENLESDYLKMPGTGGQFFYFTLPLVDGFFWSTADERAGLRVVSLDEAGNSTELILKDPIVTELSNNVLKIESSDASGNKFSIVFFENKIDVIGNTRNKNQTWALELKVPQSRIDRLPFKAFEQTRLSAEFRNFKYEVNCTTGSIQGGNNIDYIFRLLPDDNKIVIDCASLYQ